MRRSAEDIVGRARGLVGSRFRPQGRDPGTGLDCVGVILSAFELCPDDVPRNYRLAGDHARQLGAELLKHFRRVGRRDLRPGDVMMCAASAEQLHLAISCGASFVHADAKLRRVVETPGYPVWPLVAIFRRRARGLRQD